MNMFNNSHPSSAAADHPDPSSTAAPNWTPKLAISKLYDLVQIPETLIDWSSFSASFKRSMKAYVSFADCSGLHAYAQNVGSKLAHLIILPDDHSSVSIKLMNKAGFGSSLSDQGIVFIRTDGFQDWKAINLAKLPSRNSPVQLGTETISVDLPTGMSTSDFEALLVDALFTLSCETWKAVNRVLQMGDGQNSDDKYLERGTLIFHLDGSFLIPLSYVYFLDPRSELELLLTLIERIFIGYISKR